MRQLCFPSIVLISSIIICFSSVAHSRDTYMKTDVSVYTPCPFPDPMGQKKGRLYPAGDLCRLSSGKI